MQINIASIAGNLLNYMGKLLHAHSLRCPLILNTKGALQITGIGYFYIDSFKTHTITLYILPYPFLLG